MPNLENIARCLKFAMNQVLHLDLSRDLTKALPPHIAILCGDNIHSREVWKTSDYLNKPYLYDGGGEYYSYATAHHYPNQNDSVNTEHSLVEQRSNLVQWMEGPGGILVTYNR